mgnify:CR=1 FL=1|jgi:hypothetical protein
MIKKFLNWLKKAITPHRQKDEHLAFYEDEVEPDVPVYVQEKHKKINSKYKKDSE